VHRLTHGAKHWLWPLGVAGLLTACTAPPSITLPLGELSGLGELRYAMPLGDLSRSQAGTAVTVAGEVMAVLPLLDQALYQLADDSGQVWVLTSVPAPSLGTELRLEGEIRYEPIFVRGQDIGEIYVLERQRLE